MSLPRAVAAELRKTATLPAASAAFALGVLGTVAITLINAFGVRDALESGRTDTVAFTSAAETVFSAAPLGTVGAVVLGVVAFGSEYTTTSDGAGGGRQVTATLTAVPRRAAVLAAKAIAVVLLVGAMVAVALPVSLASAHAVIGEAAPGAEDAVGVASRMLGAGLYWALTALIALAVTVLSRNGVIPLIVLIVNGSLVSVSFLLTRVTPLARFLPDLAGMRLFARADLIAVEDALPPVTGGLVMAAWAVGLLAVAAAVLLRRDA
ncbi:hypothetical protein [Nocardiopsis trehalosi]|jgi:hypothetical protein|uniref:hypothetical protein n=1 Tax=Nocardiopsis trehalosi TaxID=109329 RepID=UPI00082C5890|nr:hypothetical protein [Nocardiopsis trehalosi]